MFYIQLLMKWIATISNARIRITIITSAVAKKRFSIYLIYLWSIYMTTVQIIKTLIFKNQSIWVDCPATSLPCST